MTDAAEDPFFDLAGDLLAVVDEDGTLDRVNGAWEVTLGYASATLRGRRLGELVDARDAPALRALLERAQAGRGEGSLRVMAADGSLRRVEWRVGPDREAGRLLAAGRASTDDRAVEEVLRQSEQRYRELFEGHPVAMAVWDPASGEILAANDAALRQYGYERQEIIGLSVERLVHPEDLPRLTDAVPHFGTGIAGAASFRHLRRDGSEIEVEVTGHRLAWGGRPARLVMAIDVTERRQLEAQLRQAQKMEAIGRVAGGIAHDINNILTVISGYSRLLIETISDDAPERADAEQIRDAADRAASLTTQLLSFSRRGLVRPSTVDLNEVVREVHRMLQRVIGAHVEVRVSLEAKAPFVHGDPAQLQQVVVNLALNARDAMPAGGVLAIETKDGSDVSWTGGLVGPVVLLSVSDTGVGMTGELKERAFEPFFTTKGPGRGTGLGLASVYATVSQAAGRIRLDSAPGHGTTVWIVLPVVKSPIARTSAEIDAPGDGSSGALVLLVEDEEPVRRLLERLLRRAGFAVLSAEDGRRALELAEAQPGRIDLLLSDVVMPGMSGTELARELRTRRPETRVLLISGYTEESVGSAGSDGIDLLAKPFTDNQLLARIRAILND